MRRDKKRNFITTLKKGNVPQKDFIGLIKYKYSQDQREYLLNKTPKLFSDLAYNFPIPISENEICKVEGYLSDKTSLIIELAWYFDILKKYSDKINKYLSIKEDIECTILNNKLDKCLDLLDKLDEDVCCSFFALQTELYINEIKNKSGENKELIKKFSLSNNSQKLILLLDFARLKADKKISAVLYDSAIDHHKKQYSKELKHILDYIDYKLNPVRFEDELSELTFLTYFDSDFSIIDRYNSLKNLLSIVLFEKTTQSDVKEFLKVKIKEFSKIFNDTYWEKILIIIDDSFTNISVTKNNDKYSKILDLYLSGQYNEVIEESNSLFKSQSNFSDVFILYAKSVIFSNKKITDFIDDKTKLYEILQLIVDILLKNDDYTSNRDKLLDKYYLISHFDFSAPLLEFLYDEYRFTIPKGVKYLTYLKEKAFSYNSYSLLLEKNKYLKLNSKNNVFDFVNNEIIISKNNQNSNIFFETKMKINLLIYQRKENEAILELIKFENQFGSLLEKHSFIETWHYKTSINCYFSMNNLKKVSNLIVQAYFKNLFAYDHFFDQKFIIAFDKIDEEDVFRDISIPILFELYNQPQSSIYDRIADFLINNDIKYPSEIFEINQFFEDKMLIYFLEKVCTIENIEDSPFLNSIEALEAERIKILNKLKLINEDKIEIFNAEIMSLTKAASLRKGLLQIHESRIYIDTLSIEKYLGVELPDLFDRYLNLTDIAYSSISSLKLYENIEEDGALVTFYLKELIPENELPLYLSKIDPSQDPNAVTVPVIRFIYFVDIFNAIKKEFVYSEDYGFRSFLSMRIRHGTFSNVLRSVFDKYFLISSMDSSLQDYKEINYWNKNLKVSDKSKTEIQNLLNEFSRKIDSIIELGLSWIGINNEFERNSSGIFDFYYSKAEMYILYQNRFGKIDNYEIFLEETFNSLFERLDENLSNLRDMLTNELSVSFLHALEELQENISLVVKNEDQINPIKQKIISCKTEFQLIISQITKWFNVSKNQYIEEFPIDMIVQNSLDYINSIHTGSIQNAIVKTDCSCSSNFKGKYFETFGDMLINIFDNIVSKNKDLGNQLKIDINIKQINESIEILVKNNISGSIDIDKLKIRVTNIIQNVADYKKEGIDSSFEEGSGFLKICKCIAVDLERDYYEVTPSVIKNSFEVKINFELNKLIV